MDGVTSQRLESVKVFSQRGILLDTNLVIFPKFYFSFELVIFHPTSWQNCQAHVVILPQFFLFILDGPFCHHNSASKTDASSRGSVRIQVLIGALILAQG